MTQNIMMQNYMDNKFDDKEIRDKAYERYQWRVRNGMSGNEQGDWNWAIDELARIWIEKQESPYFYTYKHDRA